MDCNGQQNRGRKAISKMSNETFEASKIQIINLCMKKSIGETDPDASIRAFLQEAGRLLRAHAIYIFTINEDHSYDRTFTWREDGQAPRADMQTITEDQFVPEWWDAFHAGKMVIDKNFGRFLTTDAKGYKRIREAELNSIVIVPIVLGNHVHGLLVFSNVAEEFLHGNDELYEISASYVAVMLQQRQNVEYIKETAAHDELTRVLSINAFWNMVDPLIRRTRDDGTAEKMAIIFLDIHHFKIINGTNGHEAGDKLLQELGTVLIRFAGGDAVGRSTADHFYVVTEDAGAEKLVRRVHDYMQREAEMTCDIRAGIYTIDGTEISASLAAGRAKLARDLIADNQYLYYRRYDMNTENRLIQDTYITRKIDEALEKEWVEAYYQPVVNPLTGRISGFEALARWNDPEWGLLSPASFIGALEESWLLYKLDLYIIEKVCRHIARSRELGISSVPVSVNLSRHDLELPELHEKINAILDSFNLEHEMLAIEITESALIDSEQVIQDNIGQFHRDGYQVWLDDFGSGYSSLNAVQNYDFDVLKIDMQFLRNQNEKTPVILSDIVDMAKRTGMLALSEGVETREDYDFLKEIGCNFIQGYYIARPLPAKECYRFIRDHGYLEETKEDRKFYRTIGRVNILRSFFSPAEAEEQNTGSRDPISISIVENGLYHTVYVNNACRKWFEFIRSSDPDFADDADADTNGRKSINSERIWECIDGLQDPGDYAHIDYITKGYSWKLVFQMIAKDRNRRAFMVLTPNPYITIMTSGTTESNE